MCLHGTDICNQINDGSLSRERYKEVYAASVDQEMAYDWGDRRLIGGRKGIFACDACWRGMRPFIEKQEHVCITESDLENCDINVGLKQGCGMLLGCKMVVGDQCTVFAVDTVLLTECKREL